MKTSIPQLFIPPLKFFLHHPSSWVDEEPIQFEQTIEDCYCSESEEEDWYDEWDYIDEMGETWDDILVNKKIRGKNVNSFYQRNKKSNNYRQNKGLDIPNERRYPQIISYTPFYISERISSNIAKQKNIQTQISSRGSYVPPVRRVANNEADLQEAIIASLNTQNATVLECGLTSLQVQELSTRELTPEDYELLLLLDEQVMPKTAGIEIINQFPEYSYSTELGQRLEQDSCMICLEEYEMGEKVKEIPKCGHYFHKECLSQWLGNSSTNCPLDGMSVVSE